MVSAKLLYAPTWLESLVVRGVCDPKGLAEEIANWDCSKPKS